MLELLNNVRHAALRVHTARGARYGDAHRACPITADEFRLVQSHYPIVFQPDGQGSFQPVALFGLVEGENLFIGEQSWDADYIPLAMRRMPFSIGVDGEALRMMVDMASPRIAGEAEGEAVFLPQGGQSDYIEGVNAVLATLHEGLQALPAFVQALQVHQLLEPLHFEVERPDGSKGVLQGYSVIHEERLAALDASTIGLLHGADYLQPIYMAIASLGHLGRLARLHLARA